MKHIVALSGGKDSTAMALRLAEMEPRDYEYICTPTGNELPEMIAHWLRLGKLLGTPIRPITSGKSLGGLIRLQGSLPNWRMRWCTRLLKIEPFQQYIFSNQPCVVYVGIRYDETESRDGADFSGDVIRRFPLVEWKWGLADVVNYLECKGIAIPARTDCAACFFQTQWEWYQLWLNYPDQWKEAEDWEELTGHTLRSPGRDSWPAGLVFLRQLFESGVKPKQSRGMQDRQVMCSTCAR